jgi:phasin family protein
MKTSTSGAKSRKALAGQSAAGPMVKRDEARVGSGLASTILRKQRKDIEVLAQAGLASHEGIQAVVQRHREILLQSLSELRAVGKVMRSAGARESVTQLDDLGRGVVSLTLASIHELANLAAATQKEAFKLLEQRLREDLADLNRRRRRAKVTRPAKASAA